MERVAEIKRKNGVASIKMESGDVIRVPSAVYLERRVHARQEIDPEAYRQFAAERGYPHALEAAMKFLALRERSEKEVCQRLRRSCFDEKTIARVMETLGRHRLVSDERFAEAWVHSRARKYGKGRIAQELRLKGVSGAKAQEALNTLSEADEYQKALEQARKLKRKFQGDPQRMAQSLIRKGYSWAMAKRAAQEAAAEQN